jgi:hypothetical protein
MFDHWKESIRELYKTSPLLTFVTILMAVDLIATTGAALVDHTIVTGMPVWIKPMKFAISTGIYSASLALVIQNTNAWKKALRLVDLFVGLALILEIALIDLQAFRHTTSHFNNSTPFNKSVFAAMGVGIGTLWLGTLVACIATFRARYRDRVWAVVARFGMLLVVIGSGTGGLMTRPTPIQVAYANQTGKMPIVGAHTVGAPDGQEGLPLTGWSERHGDIRIAHFVGLHGLQALALLAVILQSLKWGESRRLGLIRIGAASYAGLFALLLWQALRAEPLLLPSPAVGVGFMVWFVVTLGSVLAVYAATATNQPSNALAGERL